MCRVLGGIAMLGLLGDLPAAPQGNGPQLNEVYRNSNFQLTGISNLQANGVSRLTADHKMQTILTDPRLQWPDTFSEGPDGSMYVTASHINDSPTYNEGKSIRTSPYAVFKFNPKH